MNQEQNFDYVVITLDIDWAPDFVIENVLDIMSKFNVKSTFFMTHASSSISRIRKNPLFELGIHPNFLPKSTQGRNPKEILQNLKNIIPEATSVRTHSLVQSTLLLEEFSQFDLKNDVSIFLPNCNNLRPVYIDFQKVLRFPFFWEDDLEMREKQNWDISKFKFHEYGLKIFNFHPIYIYLNSKNMTNYNIIKNEIGLDKITDDNISQYINSEKGAKTFFLDLLNTINPKKSFTINELHNLFFEK